MRSMKRVRLAVLFLIAVALLAGTPALAGQPWPGQWPHRRVNVELTPTGAEPTASGVGTLEYGGFYPNYSGSLTVSCKGLTPGATYCVWFCIAHYDTWFWYTWESGPLPASAKGTGKVTIYFSGLPNLVAVRNANGDDVLTAEF